MMEDKAQTSAASKRPSPLRIDPLALATLVGVVVMLTISFWNLWNQNRLAQRISAIEAKLPTEPDGPDPSRTYTINTQGAPTKGPDNAPVTIVEFTDFQCPFCAKAVPTLKQIEERYKGSVRVVFKHMPLSMHKDAMGAALAAEGARRQGKFWEFHDWLFAHQDKLGQDDLKQHAKELGLDQAQFEADLRNADEQKRVDADVAEADALGVVGTPSFFVNGRFVYGAQPFEAFAKVIDEELTKAKAKSPSSSSSD
jgi:protein-disulfide isomerase